VNIVGVFIGGEFTGIPGPTATATDLLFFQSAVKVLVGLKKEMYQYGSTSSLIIGTINSRFTRCHYLGSHSTRNALQQRLLTLWSFRISPPVPIIHIPCVAGFLVEWKRCWFSMPPPHDLVISVSFWYSRYLCEAIIRPTIYTDSLYRLVWWKHLYVAGR
jgi:hypothetical protein